MLSPRASTGYCKWVVNNVYSIERVGRADTRSMPVRRWAQWQHEVDTLPPGMSKITESSAASGEIGDGGMRMKLGKNQVEVDQWSSASWTPCWSENPSKESLKTWEDPLWSFWLSLGEVYKIPFPRGGSNQLSGALYCFGATALAGSWKHRIGCWPSNYCHDIKMNKRIVSELFRMKDISTLSCSGFHQLVRFFNWCHNL